MLESKIQSKIIDFLKKEGACSYKIIKSSKGGCPDILSCYKGFFLALEIKTETGKVSPLQEYNINKIKKSGGLAFIVRSIADVKKILKQFS